MLTVVIQDMTSVVIDFFFTCTNRYDATEHMIRQCSGGEVDKNCNWLLMLIAVEVTVHLNDLKDNGDLCLDLVSVYICKV